MSSEFKLGTTVRILSLGKNGEIVAILKNNIFEISIGALKMKVAATDLKPVEEKPHKRKGKDKSGIEHTKLLSSKERKQASRIDLHGLTVADAIEKIDYAIDRAVLGDIAEIEVIHGIGSGKVMTGIRKHLGTLTCVKRFKADDSNPGVTWVYL